MTRLFTLTMPMLLVLLCGAGCQQPEFNPTPTTGEFNSLSEPIQLTHGFTRAGEAYFSPDMKWIIFQASMKPGEDFVMYLAQTRWEGGRIVGLNTPIRVSNEGSWNSCGYFSPDGNSLIFSSTVQAREKEHTGPATGPSERKGGYKWDMPAEAEIYRADGWQGAVSALPPGGGTNLAQHALTHTNGYDAACGLSPDGKWVIYCSNVTGDPEIWAMRSDGTKQVQLTHNAGYDGGPFFSPDGKRICYRSDRKGNMLLQIFVADLKFNAAGDITGITGEKQLTNNAAVNWGPYWHPDGHHLIWATSLHGQRNFELYLMRDDGSHKTRITFTDEAKEHGGTDILPAFSPDGKYLMWTSTRGPEKTSQIWLAHFTMPKGS
jgi:Tol biopolymer transport system component